MSLLIKGATVPETCFECMAIDGLHLIIKELGGHCPMAEYMIDPRIFNARKGRWLTCPLVEVPPHGRLVDADALKATFCAECNHTITCEDCDIDYHIGRLSPTIIEAEEGEET